MKLKKIQGSAQINIPITTVKIGSEWRASAEGFAAKGYSKDGACVELFKKIANRRSGYFFTK